MKKEQLLSIGLTEEPAMQVADMSAKEMRGFIPKSRFDEVNNVKKRLEKQVVDRDRQLKELYDKAKSNEEYEKKIKNLQDENKAIKDQYEARIRDMIIDSAIQAALIDAKYPELLFGRFDKTKLSIASDGKISGIDEQLAIIKEIYKDLFIPIVTCRSSY